MPTNSNGSTNIVNPGSVWQTYNPNTGQTTYGAPPSGLYSGTGSAVVTPSSTPSGAYVAQGVNKAGQVEFAQATPQTMFTETKDALGNVSIGSQYAKTQGIMTNPAIASAVQGVTSRALTTGDLSGETTKISIPEVKATNQQKAQVNVPGSLLRPEQLASGTTLRESDIARTTSNDIYRRSLQVEKNALPDYAKSFGMPKTAEQWKRFNDYAYAGKLPRTTLPADSKSGGDTTKNDDSDNKPATTVQNDTGAIDINKFETDLRAKIQPLLDAYTAAQKASDEYGTNTAEGQRQIGDQLGVVAPLLQGEQASYQQQRAITGLKLEQAAARAQQAYQFGAQFEQNLQTQKMNILEYNRGLRKDQQDAFISQLNLALQAGMDKKSLTTEDIKWINDGAKLAGYNPNMIMDALDAKAKMNALDKQAKQAQIDNLPTAAERALDLQIKQAQLNNLKTNKGQLVETGVDEDGNKTYSVYDDKTNTLTPLPSQSITGNATSSLGDLTVTGSNGSDKWKWGLDVVIAGGKGAAVKYPFGDTGTVTRVGKNGGFGNQVQVTTSAGDQIWMSHLDGTNVKVGDKVTKGSILGTQGRSGDVYSTSGGDGTHLDITMKNKNGEFYTAPQVSGIIGVEKKAKAGSQSATDWAALINQGKTKIENVPEKLRSSVVSELAKTPSPQDNTASTKAKEKIKMIDDILKSPGLSGAVGPTKITRLNPWEALTGGTANFLASVQQLTNQETLSSLLDLKKAGGTLGALNESEGAMLRDAATKINNWALKDKTGKVYAYQASEKDFKDELEKLKRLTNIATLGASGMEAKMMDDGTVWVQSPDGSFIQVK